MDENNAYVANARVSEFMDQLEQGTTPILEEDEELRE